MNPDKQTKLFITQLKKLADPKRAKIEKKYMKSPLKFYGVSVPQKRKMVKKWLKENEDVSFKEILKVVEKLWNSDWSEERSLAVKILEYKRKELSLKQIPLIEKMINEAYGWSKIDPIAIWLVGTLIDKDLKTFKLLKKWIKSKNFWVRRTAILAQIIQFRRGEGDFKYFEKLAVSQFNEGKDWSKKERFFIRKAIGWALRELSQADPKKVYDFTNKYKYQMSGLTFREASRKLPDDLKKRLGEK